MILCSDSLQMKMNSNLLWWTLQSHLFPGCQPQEELLQRIRPYKTQPTHCLIQTLRTFKCRWTWCNSRCSNSCSSNSSTKWVAIWLAWRVLLIRCKSCSRCRSTCKSRWLQLRRHLASNATPIIDNRDRHSKMITVSWMKTCRILQARSCRYQITRPPMQLSNIISSQARAAVREGKSPSWTIKIITAIQRHLNSDHTSSATSTSWSNRHRTQNWEVSEPTLEAKSGKRPSRKNKLRNSTLSK